MASIEKEFMPCRYLLTDSWSGIRNVTILKNYRKPFVVLVVPKMRKRYAAFKRLGNEYIGK
jgi:hypothetical protein